MSHLTRSQRSAVSIAVMAILMCLGSTIATAQDLEAIRRQLEANFPAAELRRKIAAPPANTKDPIGDKARQIYGSLVGSVPLLTFNGTKLGAGIVISKDGTTVTNQHVVASAYATQAGRFLSAVFIKSPVQPVAAADLLVAKVIEENIGYDLAIVKLTSPPPAAGWTVPDLSPRAVGIGDAIFAFGHPENYLWSFSLGRVEQVRPQFKWNYTDGAQRQATLVQFDAVAARGSSGGPLLSESGDLVGIIAWHDTNDSRISFAIGLEHVRALLRR